MDRRRQGARIRISSSSPRQAKLNTSSGSAFGAMAAARVSSIVRFGSPYSRHSKWHLQAQVRVEMEKWSQNRQDSVVSSDPQWISSRLHSVSQRDGNRVGLRFKAAASLSLEVLEA